MMFHPSLRSIVRTALLASFAWPSLCHGNDIAAWFPDTTRVFLAIDDMEETKSRFDQTGLGQLWSSAAMAGFREQVEQDDSNLAEKLVATYGFNPLAVKGAKRFVAGGIEVSKEELSLTFMIEISPEAATKLVQQGEDRLRTDGSKRSVMDFPLPASIYTRDEDEVVYVIHDGYLLVSGDLESARKVVELWQGNSDARSLAQVDAFQKSLELSQGDSESDFTWYVDVIRVAVTQEDRTAEQDADPRGPFATRHGFAGLRGIGGRGRLMRDGHDFMTCFGVYAPAPKESLRSLAFVRGNTKPPPFVPAATGNTSTIRLDVREFMSHLGAPYDDATDAEGAWKGTLESLKRDSRFDLMDGLLPLLGTEVTTATVYSEQTGTERTITSIALKDVGDEKRIAAMLYLLWYKDDKARFSKHPSLRYHLWTIQITSEDGDAALNEAGVTVADGRLWLATHASLIPEILGKKSGPPLENDDDYITAMKHIAPWTNDATFARSFVRTDVDIRATYEALKAGGVDVLEESEGVYAQVLRKLLIDENDQDRSGLDFSVLPPFEQISKYFGFSVTAANIHPEGWSGIVVHYD